MARTLLGLIILVGCSGTPDVVARSHDDYDPEHPPTPLAWTGDLLAHDPSVIEVNGRVYLFSTGTGIRIRISDDFVNFRTAGSVFSENPAWISERVPNATELWSPDIEYFAGSYHLYYAASTFASNRSCIGLATSPVLGEKAVWTDRGAVICSNLDGTEDRFNAIDPDVILDASGAPHLAFGSFDSGLKLVTLDASGMKTTGELIPIAARPDANGALQAVSITQRGDYYYLFSSFDLCCAGVDSTHRLMVGRSTSLAGPYLDHDQKALLDGGGSLVLASNQRWKGPGSNTVFYRNGRAYNVYHAYDAQADGAATLRAAELGWDSAGWPISGGP